MGKIQSKTVRTVLIRDVSGAGSGLLLGYCGHFRDKWQARTGVDVEISPSFLSLNWPREVLGKGSWSVNHAAGSLAPAGLLSAAVSLLAKLLEMQSRMRGKTEICGEKLADIFLPLTSWYTSQLQTGLKAVALSEKTDPGCASCLTADWQEI